MVKTTVKWKRLPKDEDFFRELKESLLVTPLTVVDSAAQPNWSLIGRRGPDATIALRWNDQVERFAVEYKAPGTPKQIESAAQQVLQYVRGNPTLRPMIAAPYLREDLIEKLVAEEISAVDLSGNYAVVVPGRWLIMRTGKKNRYPSNAPIKNVYRGKSSLVARALMLRAEFQSASAIANELESVARVSLPTISKVLKSLEEDLIIERRESIRVIQSDRLLDNLAENYEPPVVRNRIIGKASRGLENITMATLNAEGTQIRYAMSEPSRYTVLPSSERIIRIYAESINRLSETLSIDSSTRFPDIELLETRDPTVYYGRRRENGQVWASPLQIYLELRNGGKREMQAAEQIRTNLLAFRYR